ncbi:hypothetical protein BX666DRAFT_1991987 [Dichotomocladium elegans]|nr:hypothetical protein BX666DRAFT_1991987 [Dichotomocladium elegans]
MEHKNSSTQLPRQKSPAVCARCLKEFARPWVCKRHQKVHLYSDYGIKPYACVLCVEFFSRRDSLTRHKTTAKHKHKALAAPSGYAEDRFYAPAA